MRKWMTVIVAVLLFGTTGFVLFRRYTGGDFSPTGNAASRAQATVNGAPNSTPLGCLLLREIVRQGWLVAQRDGLGLPTRDALLREPPLPGDAAVPDLSVKTYIKSDCDLATVPGTGKGTWQDTIPHSEINDKYSDMLTAVEKRSRGGFVTAIRSMGFAGTPPKTFSGPEPDLSEAERLLGEMNFFSQFAAVRLAHQSAKDVGLSPRAMGVLVRGYANLGLLTRCLWNATSQGMAARSLVYGQRLYATAPAGDPAAQRWARWHRAYASAMAGFPSDALEDLAAAQKLGGADKAPEWVAPLDAFCRYQTHKLTDLTAAASGDNVELPAFLTYLTIEHTASPSALNQFGRAVLQGEPDNLRVVDAVAAISGVAANHQLTQYALLSTAKATCDRVMKLPGVPAPVAAAAKAAADAKYAPEPTAAVARALVDAGAADRGEPSWAVLGRMVQDANYLNVYRRVFFEVRMWNVDASASVAALYPLVADHPYGPTVRLLLADRLPDEQRRAMVKDVNVVDPQGRMLRMLDELGHAGNEPKSGPAKVWGFAVKYTHDYTVWDSEDYYQVQVKEREFKERALEALKDCCPLHPIVVADKIVTDWPASEAEAVKAAEAEGGSPLIVGALGQRYSQLKDWPKAEHYLRMYVEVCQDAWAYQLLADDYLAQGDEDKWLATMQEFLQQPDYRLDHAQMNVVIARHFMKDGRFEKAQPFANAAAESWAGWAMEVAAECEAGQGHWDTAETWIKREQERYGPADLWLKWCKRTGHGDRAAAERAAQQASQ